MKCMDILHAYDTESKECIFLQMICEAMQGPREMAWKQPHAMLVARVFSTREKEVWSSLGMKLQS